MVSTLNLEEKFNRVRRNFCFYLDVQDHGLARSLSRRLQDMGLQEETVLSSRVTHVVSDGLARAARGGGAPCSAGRARAHAMLRRLPHAQHTTPHPHLVHLSVHKAICLLDKLYDTFFPAPRKSNVKVFSKHFIKIEFLDKPCRPVFKEFDEWPQISLEPDPPKEKKKESPIATFINNNNIINPQSAGQKMTRKSRPRIKEREEKEPKGGYCEMCNVDYADAAVHRRSPHHLAFIKDHNNFLSLDSLINSGADVESFLDKAAPINGERRSLRKICNGDVEPKTKRSKRSQSPESPVNGDDSPKQNGGVEDEKKHNTRCSKKTDDDRQYYKVVGVSTKLRSSGGFTAKRKESPPTCNGTKPLVVKFRKVRRSELSVLSDEAEQFMFPKRASSTDSSSSSDDEKPVVASPPQPPPSIERRRLARPVALKEESSEEDMWPEDRRRRKRRAGPVAKRGRRVPLRSLKGPEPPPPDPQPKSPTPEPKVEPTPEPTPELTVAPVAVSPLREETEKCMKWEEGRLKYTPAVEQLEFAFESVPLSEPWYETFKRQDQDKVVARNIPQYFELYSKSPKLPYEMGQLPPLKPNCCPLSDLVKREEKAGPSRSYGTRGMKKQKIRKRTAALLALEGHPRKSPREHASTLAILGSAGLLHRRKHLDDAKSTASEDTVSDSHSTVKLEPTVSEVKVTSERLQQFLSEVFDDAADFEVSEDVMDGEAAVTTSTNVDVSSLMSDYDNCDIIRNEMKEGVEARARGRRSKFKKMNKTGWPKKRRPKKDSSRTNSSESEKKSTGRSSVELDDETTQDTISEDNSEAEEKIELRSDDNSEAEEKIELRTDDEDDKTLVEVQERTRAKASREKMLEKLRDKSQDKSPVKSDSEKSQDRTLVRRGDKSPDATIDKSPVKDIDKSPAKSVDRSPTKTREKSLDKSHDKTREKSLDTSHDKSDTSDSHNKSDASEDLSASEKGSVNKKRTPRSSASDANEEEDRRKKKRALAGLLLQPVVRVSRVEAGMRTLRSAAKPRGRGRGRFR